MIDSNSTETINLTVTSSFSKYSFIPSIYSNFVTEWSPWKYTDHVKEDTTKIQTF